MGNENDLDSRTSESCEDPAWDDFLQGMPLGHYQQSGIWARAKAVDGWKPIRKTYMREKTIAGGFQLLHKKTALGSIGYISKGPVIAEDDPILWQTALQDICRTVQDTALRGLIVQPPDDSIADTALWASRGFLKDNPMEVIASTLLFDISEGVPSSRLTIHPDYLRKVRQARKRGVVVREGSRRDVDLFFQLMLMTCRRQGETRPQPATADALREIWDAFDAKGCVRLSIAELDGTPVAGQLNFIFGRRVTLYKKGWTSEHGECRPNHLLTHEVLDWAHRRGAALVDCAALDRDMAEALLAGKPLTSRHKECRDMFNYCFGGRPKLLPEPHVFIPGSLLRTAYRAMRGLRGLRQAVHRLY